MSRIVPLFQYFRCLGSSMRGFTRGTNCKRIFGHVKKRVCAIILLGGFYEATRKKVYHSTGSLPCSSLLSKILVERGPVRETPLLSVLSESFQSFCHTNICLVDQCKKQSETCLLHLNAVPSTHLCCSVSELETPVSISHSLTSTFLGVLHDSLQS